MSATGQEQRQQARLAPASPVMWWTPVGKQDVVGGVLVDISRGGLSFILSDDTIAPEIGDQITVHFRTPSPRPLVYSIVRQATANGATLLGCCRLLRPGARVPSPRRPKSLVEVRMMRRVFRLPQEAEQAELQFA